MEITSKELQAKIETGEPVIVAFSASWCAPCKAYKPIFQKVAQTTDVPMYIMMVDDNQNESYAVSLGIRAVPTTKSFKAGGEVFSKSGLISEGELKGILENVKAL